MMFIPYGVGLIIMLVTTNMIDCVHGQGGGNGISKYTRGQSDPRKCIKFFERYLNGVEGSGECPLGRCECATQGRVGIATGPHNEYHAFGVHSINCTYHPYGEHSLADIEEMVSAEVNDFRSGYNQHIDSHLGVWVHDLHKTMKYLEEDDAPYYLMKWTEAHDKTYYSVMTTPCGGYFIEFLADKATGIDESKFHETKEIRFDLSNFTKPDVEYKALKVSRATTKMNEMIDFYTNVIEGHLIRNETVDGVHIAWIHLKHAPQMLIQFVNRPPAHSANFTVKDLETYVNDVHDEYVKTPTCGFDQFADHHWAYDMESRTETLSSVAKKLTAGGHKYRWFSTPGRVQIYAFDPSGWSLQLDWNEGNDAPRKIPTYSAACKSNDGCRGQGLCDENQFTPF